MPRATVIYIPLYIHTLTILYTHLCYSVCYSYCYALCYVCSLSPMLCYVYLCYTCMCYVCIYRGICMLYSIMIVYAMYVYICAICAICLLCMCYMLMFYLLLMVYGSTCVRGRNNQHICSHAPWASHAQILKNMLSKSYSKTCINTYLIIILIRNIIRSLPFYSY
jgi:hypothetical protein